MDNFNVRFSNIDVNTNVGIKFQKYMHVTVKPNDIVVRPDKESDSSKHFHSTGTIL